MNNNGKIVGFVLAGLVLLPGCVRVPTYKSKSLDSIKLFNNMPTHRQTKNNLTFHVNRLSDQAQHYLFNDRSVLLDGEKVEVLHIAVHNLSADQYVISPSEIGMIQISYPNVLRAIQTSSVDQLKNAGKVGGSVYGVLTGLSCVFYAPVLFGSAVDKFGIGMVITLGTVGIVWPIVATLLASPWLAKAAKSAIMNRRIDKDLKEKMLDKEVIITSGSKHEGLIFVRSCDYTSRFSVSLTQQYHPDNKLVFDVDLLQAPHTYGIYNE